jgi:hypothetical protein
MTSAESADKRVDRGGPEGVLVFLNVRGHAAAGRRPAHPARKLSLYPNLFAVINRTGDVISKKKGDFAVSLCYYSIYI